MREQQPDNVFHQHLDVCARCRNQPFNLCPLGAVALHKAVQDIEGVAVAPTQPRRTGES